MSGSLDDEFLEVTGMTHQEYERFMCGCPICVMTNRQPTLKYRRGVADGRQGHPPAEVTEDYLLGYTEGLKERE